MKKFMSMITAIALFTVASSAFADYWYCSSNDNYYGQSECTVSSVTARNYNDQLWIYVKLADSSECNYLLVKNVSDTQASSVEALVLTALTSGKKIRFRKNGDPTTIDPGQIHCYSDQIAIGE